MSTLKSSLSNGMFVSKENRRETKKAFRLAIIMVID